MYSRPVHQIHCSPYPNYYPQPYQHPPPPQDLCYSPSYQPFYPPKIYQNNGPPPLGRFYRPNTGYYPPNDLYERPPPQNVPPSGQLELVPAGPSGQHMEHYPGPTFYTAGYNPGGQCYNRPYLGK